MLLEMAIKCYWTHFWLLSTMCTNTHSLGTYVCIHVQKLIRLRMNCQEMFFTLFTFYFQQLLWTNWTIDISLSLSFLFSKNILKLSIFYTDFCSVFAIHSDVPLRLTCKLCTEKTQSLSFCTTFTVVLFSLFSSVVLLNHRQLKCASERESGKTRDETILRSITNFLLWKIFFSMHKYIMYIAPLF